MKLLYVLLFIIFIILIFRYFTNIEGMLETEKNTAIDKIKHLSKSMDNDYKVFNNETMNMSNQQQMLSFILGIATVIILGITFIYVKNK